ARRAKVGGLALVLLSASALVCVPASRAENQPSDWQSQVRKYAEAKDWDSAMRVVEQQIARAPQDMDVRAWRARVLGWSGRLPEARRRAKAWFPCGAERNTNCGWARTTTCLVTQPAFAMNG